MGWLSRLLRRKDDRRERRAEEELLREDAEAQAAAYASDDVPASVIRYVPADDEDVSLNIEVLCEDFHGKILPEKGSVIWITRQGVPRPFKVARIDFIENGSAYDVSRVYVVVEPATFGDVNPNPRFGAD